MRKLDISDFDLAKLTELYRKMHPLLSPQFRFFDQSKAVTQVTNFAHSLLEQAKLPNSAFPITSEGKFIAEQIVGLRDADEVFSCEEIKLDTPKQEQEQPKAKAENVTLKINGAKFNLPKNPLKPKIPKPELPKPELPKPEFPKPKAARNLTDESLKKMSVGTKKSWEDPNVAKARAKRNYVSVDGKAYKSAIQAASENNIPESLQIPLRKVVKCLKHVTLHINGITQDWVLLGATGETLKNGLTPSTNLDIKEVSKMARALSVESYV